MEREPPGTTGLIKEITYVRSRRLMITVDATADS